MKPVLVAFLCFALIACGFQLRKGLELPDHITEIGILPDDPYTDFQRELRRNLRIEGVEVASNPRAAPVVLVLGRERISERVLSVSGQGAQAREAMLTLNTSYTVVFPEDKSLEFSDDVSIEREYSYNPDDALAKTEERDLILKEMRIDAIRQMMRQVGTRLSYLDTPTEEETIIDETAPGTP